MSAEQKAGRELDALVAEKVMGWLWLERFGHRLFGPSSEVGKADPLYGTTRAADLTRDDLVVEDAWWLRDATQHADVQVVPHYSTDIAAAWAVVEKLGAEGWALHLKAFRHENPPPNEAHSAMFWSRVPMPITRYASSTPVAICLAALSAVSADGVAHESRKKVSR